MSHLMTPGQRSNFDAKCSAQAGGCTVWTGYCNDDGYGRVNLDNRVWNAHRANFVDANGPIHDDVLVLHGCDNPPCVNLDHLYAGDDARNAADRAARGRSATTITNDDVRAIRVADGTQRAIAKAFSVSPAAVCLIKAGKRRTYVEA